MNNDFSYTILEYINNAIRNSAIKPFNLGGVSASGGGSGTPPGGYVGYLPQTRVGYDLSEVASSGLPASGWSLLDNLNHIRYDIQTLETTISGGVGGGHIIMDEGVELTQRDYINFVGSGITVTDGTVGGDLNSDPVLDATASADLDTAATYLEWSHVLGSGSDRIVIVGVALRTATSSSVTFNGVSMTLLRRDRPGTDVCSELWYILESELPIGGTYTVRVNASESAKFVGGSISYSNCIGIVEGSATGDTGTASWSDVPMIDPFATHQVMIDVIALQEGGNSVTEGDVGQYAFCNENTGDAVGGMSWKVWEEEGEYDGSIWIFGNSSVWASTIVVIQGGALGTAATIVTVTGATGSFTTADSKTVTVVGGIITSIV